MPRAKGGFKTHRRHKRILKAASGYFLGRGKLWRTAVIQVRRAWAASFKGRKQKKRDFRGLWIQRINAGARQLGVSYSRLIHGLKVNNIEIDRKMLSDLAVREPAIFNKIVDSVKA
ncbi:50S ribosomal protein L20 [Myxococcota bacterium]|nr:50S ribosomal protein L20 [Myxococcota bacterium]MBU1382397.1 50S ribosomal protein L20 [Myxococcota bacterium]MBU1495944.1 50S ribosomal protein L20 [Myxococcota bacterium]